jgi:polyphenol oxidase
MNAHAEWIVSDWPAPPGVRALITTRAGGVSTGPYRSLNLGTATGDEPARVAENRARVRRALPADPVWLAQVHGSEVADADVLPLLPRADASIATRDGVVCAVLVADCIPVLLCDMHGRAVAAAHAGWRGLAAGVLRNTITRMGERGVEAADILAYVGPGIGPAAFEVGSDVYDAFVGLDAAATAFTPRANAKWMADLHALVRQALKTAGVERVYGQALCTASDPSRFFSYRRDGITGRMAALVWRSP